MPSRIPSSIHELLLRQDGVLARTQALRHGMSEHTWNWQRRRFWKAVLPGVVISHTGVPTDRQRAWAAVLHGGTDALLHGDAALLDHGFKIDLAQVDVAVPFPRRVRAASLLGGPKLLCHTLDALDPAASRAFGPPVAAVACAALRAADWSSTPRAAAWRLAAVVQRGLTTAETMRVELAKMSEIGCRDLLTRVLDDVAYGAHAGSELEFLEFLRSHGLPEPDRLQVLVRTETGKRYLDGRYDRQKVSVEVDGAHHMEVAQWDADALRSLELAVARRGSGETVIRLTMGNMRHDGPKVATLLRDALA